MACLRSSVLNESHGAQKAVLALGACAVAGVALLKVKRLVATWRKEHLQFDFPIEEEMFVGWGGGSPRQLKRPAL